MPGWWDRTDPSSTLFGVTLGWYGWLPHRIGYAWESDHPNVHWLCIGLHWRFP